MLNLELRKTQNKSDNKYFILHIYRVPCNKIK